MQSLSLYLRPGSEIPKSSYLYIEGVHAHSLDAKSAEDFSAKLRIYLDDINHLKFLDHLYFEENFDLIPAERERLKIYEAVARKTIAVIKSSFGSFEDSLLGTKNLFQNIDIALQKPDIKHLKISKPFQAIVVSAGPSLDLEFENLRRLQKNCLIISVDAALKTLLKEGITPHLVTVVERDDYSIPFFDHLPANLSTGLVAHPLIDRRIFKKYPGQIISALKFIGSCLWLPFDRARFWTGSSSAHLAYRTAVNLGAQKIALVGQDLCFHPETFQSHTTVEDYPDWSKHSTLEERKKESSIIPAIGNTYELVYTKATWFMFANDFQIILKETNTPTVNTSKLGMKIDGLPFQPLQDWAQDVSAEKIDFSIPNQNPFLEADRQQLLSKQESAIDALTNLKNEIRECVDYQKLYQEIITKPHFIELVFEPVFANWVEVENKGTGYKEFLQRSEEAIDRVLEALSFKI